MQRRAALASSIALLLSVSCCDRSDTGGLSAGRSLDPSRVAGCYELTVGEWRYEYSDDDLKSVRNLLRDNPHVLAEVREIPPWIWLDTLPVYHQADSTVGRMLLAPPPAYPPASKWRSWTLTAGDSIRSGWGPGLYGAYLMLKVTGDSIHGVARTWSDEMSLDAVANVTGYRVHCLSRTRTGTRSHFARD